MRFRESGRGEEGEVGEEVFFGFVWIDGWFKRKSEVSFCCFFWILIFVICFL